MKPAAFIYKRPGSLNEAVAALAEHGAEAKILAGGQSLVPLLNFRMVRPAALIDINRVPGLEAVAEREDGGIRVGALTRHHMLETSPLVKRRFPILHEAMRHVAHLAIRNRGTLGGSLSHADPAAELPMMAVLLDAEIAITAASRTRRLPARGFFVGALTTALDEDEMVTEVSFPALPAATGWGFEEVSQRSGDFAVAAVAALLTLQGDKVSQARIALMGVDETSIRATLAEKTLVGERRSDDLLRAAADSARAVVHPTTDLRASADYRRHLVGVLTRRVLAAAWGRAEQTAS